MRHDKAAALVELARALAGSAEGLTLDEMATATGMGRRTAERMRDKLIDLFPQLETVSDPPTKRWRIPSGLDGFLQAPTADELAAVGAAIAELERTGASSRAAALKSLEGKVLAALRAPARRRIAPDLEALLQAEAIAVQAGPRPSEDEQVLGAIREALKGGSGLSLRYEGGRTPGNIRTVTPYGLLFGRANYLVAAEGPDANMRGEPRNWRIDRLRDVAVSDKPALRPEGFSLQAYADRSFGIYQDQPEDVELLFSKDAAEAALRWRFHIGQSVAEEADGRVRVSFRASGMKELALHLFTWGDSVRIVKPDRLKTVMAEAIAAAARGHGVGAAS